MSLKPFTVTIPFSESLAENVDSRLVPDTHLTGLENGRIDKQGVIKKRAASTGILTTSFTRESEYVASIAQIQRLEAWKDELLAFEDERYLYAYSSQATRWALRGPICSAMAGRYSIRRDPNAKAAWPDCVYSGGFLFVGYITGETVVCDIIDEATGAVIVKAKKLSVAGATNCRVIDVSGTVCVLWATYEGTPDTILMATIVATGSGIATGFTAPITLVTDAAWDMFEAIQVDAPYFCVGYYRSTPSNQIRIVKYNTAGTVQNSQTRTWSGLSDGLAIAIDYDAAEPAIYMLWYNNASSTLSNIILTKFTTSLGFTSEVTVRTSAATNLGYSVAGLKVKTSSLILCMWQEYTLNWSGTDVDAVTVSWHWVGAMATLTLVNIQHCVEILSRPFLYDGEFYVAVSGDSGSIQYLTSHPTTFLPEGVTLCKVESERVVGGLTSGVDYLRPVGHALSNEGLPIREQRRAARNVSVNGSKHFLAASVNLRHPDLDELYLEGCEALSFDFQHPSRFMSGQFGDWTMHSGGVPFFYDGAWPLEPSVSLSKPIIVHHAASSGGNLTTTGTYSYKATVEYIDRFGNRHMSEPSLPITRTLTGTDKTITVRVRPPPLSLIRNDYFRNAFATTHIVYLWRTKNGGTTYYCAGYAPVTRPFTSFTDTEADTTIDDNEQIYTTGGEKPNTHLPSCHVVIEHADRLIAASSEITGRIYFSKPRTPSRGIEFSIDAFYIDAPDGGAVTSLASQDTRCIVFKREQILAIDGLGPGVTGVPAQAFTVRSIASGIGCLSHTSTVVTPIGTIFRSRRGFYLLDRGLQLQYIGAAIEDTAAAYPTVMRGVLDAPNNVVRYMCSAGAETPIRVLVFNYQRMQWGIDRYAAYEAVTPRDMCMVADRFYLALRNSVYYEPTAGAGDGSASNHVSLTVESPWIKISQAQDFKRIWRMILLARRLDSHKLEVSIGYNYKTTYDTVFTLTASDIDTVGTVEQFRFHMPIQKVQAIRVKIKDLAPPSGFAALGYELNALTLLCGMKKSVAKLPATQSR